MKLEEGPKLSSNVEDRRNASPYQAFTTFVTALVDDYNYRWNKAYAKSDPAKSKAPVELAKQAGVDNIEGALNQINADLKAEQEENIRKFREWREETSAKSSQVQGGQSVATHSAPASTPSATKQEVVVKK